MSVRLSHLGLVVRDEERSRAFYERWFGFDAGPWWRAEDGTLLLRDADGFDLALHPGEPGALPGFFHFGFSLPDADAVRALLARLGPARDDDRKAAAALYRELYERAPNVEYRRAYERLTGTLLPPGAPLPPPPEVTGPAADVEELLGHVEELLGQSVELTGARS